MMKYPIGIQSFPELQLLCGSDCKDYSYLYYRKINTIDYENCFFRYRRCASTYVE